MLNPSRVATPFACTALALLGSSLFGCGTDNLANVSGKVTFQGKPVPAGKVYILPDSAKGNTGPAGFADIKDGTYDTKLPGGQPAPPGPVIFAIEGIDPVPPLNAAPDVTSTVLFPHYECSGELADSANTKDLEVPASAAQVAQRPTPGP
jgi:hypothetical protein